MGLETAPLSLWSNDGAMRTESQSAPRELYFWSGGKSVRDAAQIWQGPEWHATGI